MQHFTWTSIFLTVCTVFFLSACATNRKITAAEPVSIPVDIGVQNSDIQPQKDPVEVILAKEDSAEPVSIPVDIGVQNSDIQPQKDPVEVILAEEDSLEIKPLDLEPTPLDEIVDLDLDNQYTITADPHLKQLIGEDLRETRFDIPVVYKDSVVKFINYYQTRGRKVMETGLRRSGKYLPLFREIFEKEGVPKDLIYMAHVESLFKPRAYSRAKAKGIWQFISYTGRRYGLRQDWWIDERSDIIKSTHAAARYLKDLYEEFGDWNLALAGYNSGENRIRRILKRYGPMDYWTMVKRRLLPRETRNYVPSILASLIIYKHPEYYKFQVKPEKPMEYDLVLLKEQQYVWVAAEEIGISEKKLTEFNPELRRGITPIDYPEYQLKVPLGKGKLLEERLANLPPEKQVRAEHHKVRRGDTLSVIARMYSSSIRAIAKVNHIRNVHKLRIGQDLIIPLAGLRFSSRNWSDRQAGLPGTYIVRRGDTLAKIAQMYRVRLRDVLRWNGLRANQIIIPGQRVRILDESKSVNKPIKSAGDQ